MMFSDRRDAGVKLAAALGRYRDQKGVLVLGLPRGGVTVADEVARALHAPLDILIVRKIGFPTNPELAVGAVAETGAVVLNQQIISGYGVRQDYLDRETARQREEIARRKELYRGGRGIPPLAGKTVILIDDGVATGATMKAAIAALRQEEPARLVAALPVASPDAEREIGRMVDELVCLHAPFGFMAVGGYYRNFDQVEDAEVVEMLRQAGKKEGIND
jgi:putative phosphoribosyl transferase